MNKTLQTILVFVAMGAMIAFIFSALRPAQYLMNSEYLVISDNIASTCNNELGSTLARAIKSESFQNDLNKFQNQNTRTETTLEEKNIIVKNYKDNNIVNVKIGGKSLLEVQVLAKNIQRGILEEAYKYYSPQDKIRIQTLINPMIVRTPKVILENSLGGGLLGGLIGLIVIIFTEVRFDLFAKNRKTFQDKNINKIKPVVKNKKSIRDSKKYKDIVKKRLEKELTKEPVKELELLDDNYVFSIDNKDKKQNKKYSLAENVRRKALKTGRIKDKEVNKKRTFNKNDIPQTRVISASTMFVGEQTKKNNESKVPDNLPVFIEEKLPKDKEEIEKVKATIKKQTTRKQEEDKHLLKQKNALETKKDYKRNKQKHLSKSGTEKNVRNSERIFDEKLKDSERLRQEVSTKKRVSTKKGEPVQMEIPKASAHDIANGFAPDPKGDEGPTNEEIKERLNRLLRGEL